MDDLIEDRTPSIEEGINGVLCMECGGATPGIGCAGKGIVRLFDHLNDNMPEGVDVRIHDVLGDVVCGGFSVPMRKENTDSIILVISEEFMSIYAANNILLGLKNLNDGPCILGVIINSRSPDNKGRAEKFAEAAELRILGRISKDPIFAEADMQGRTVLELSPDSGSASEINGIVEAVHEAMNGRLDPMDPHPLSDDAMADIAAGLSVRENNIPDKGKQCDFDVYDHMRGITYKGNFVMPSCTSHGAIELLQEITDAAVVLLGPRNCAFLTEYANRRRALKLPATDGSIRSCNLYSTGMDDDTTFSGDAECLRRTIEDVMSKGFRTVFVVPTCTPLAIGTDIEGIVEGMGRDDVEIMVVPSDDVFLGSKFGCYGGALKCIKGMMDNDIEIIPDTVNLMCYSAPALSRKENLREIEKILGAMGLRLNTVFNGSISTNEIKALLQAEFDIQINDTFLNDMMCDVLLEGRDHRMLKMPNGTFGVRKWVSAFSEMTGRYELGEKFIEDMMDNYQRQISPIRKHTDGLRSMIYMGPNQDVDWYVDTLKDLGVSVECIVHWKGAVSDEYDRPTRHKDIKHVNDVSLCGLKDIVEEVRPDIIISSDVRVGTTGVRWVGFSTNLTGIPGTVYWAKKVRNALRIPLKDGWRMAD